MTPTRTSPPPNGNSTSTLFTTRPLARSTTCSLDTPFAPVSANQGLTLLHFSAHRELIVWDTLSALGDKWIRLS